MKQRYLYLYLVGLFTLLLLNAPEQCGNAYGHCRYGLWLFAYIFIPLFFGICFAIAKVTNRVIPTLNVRLTALTLFGLGILTVVAFYAILIFSGFGQMDPKSKTYNNAWAAAYRVSMYIQQHNSWPPSLDAVPQEDGKSFQTPTDAWKHPFQYQISDRGIVTFTSFGKDNKPGGTGDDADMSVSFYLERGDDGKLTLGEKEMRDAYPSLKGKSANDWLKHHRPPASVRKAP